MEVYGYSEAEQDYWYQEGVFFTMPMATDAEWRESRNAITAFEREAEAAINGVGIHDGHGTDGIGFDEFFYGPNAQTLYTALEPIIIKHGGTGITAELGRDGEEYEVRIVGAQVKET